MKVHFSALHGTKSWPGAWESLSVYKTAYIAVRLWTHCTEMEISLLKESNRYNLVPRQLFTCIEEKTVWSIDHSILVPSAKILVLQSDCFYHRDSCVGTDVHDIINCSEQTQNRPLHWLDFFHKNCVMRLLQSFGWSSAEGCCILKALHKWCSLRYSTTCAGNSCTKVIRKRHQWKWKWKNFITRCLMHVLQYPYWTSCLVS